jgi:hypothetical protein
LAKQFRVAVADDDSRSMPAKNGGGTGSSTTAGGTFTLSPPVVLSCPLPLLLSFLEAPLDLLSVELLPESNNCFQAVSKPRANCSHGGVFTPDDDDAAEVTRVSAAGSTSVSTATELSAGVGGSSTST